MSDKYIKHVDLTTDVGASVVVPGYSKDRVLLLAGGDLSISVGFPSAQARELGEALIAAANACQAAP